MMNFNKKIKRLSESSRKREIKKNILKIKFYIESKALLGYDCCEISYFGENFITESILDLLEINFKGFEIIEIEENKRFKYKIDWSN